MKEFVLFAVLIIPSILAFIAGRCTVKFEVAEIAKILIEIMMERKPSEDSERIFQRGALWAIEAFKEVM